MPSNTASRSSLLLILLAMLIAGAGIFLFAGGPKSESAAQEEPRGASATSAGAVDTAANGSSAGLEGSPMGDISAAGSRVDRTVALSGSGGEPITVELTDRDGRPWADTEIVVLDRAHHDEGAFGDALAVKGSEVDAAVLRRFGHGLRTDAEGRVEFGWSGETTEVHALLPWTIATERVVRSRLVDGVLSIEVARPPLIVQVVGPDGRGVPGVRALISDRPEGERRRSWGPELGSFPDRSRPGITGADGLAYPGNAIEAASEGIDDLSGWWVCVDALTRNASMVQIPTPHDPSIPVRVELPATGPVEVEVVEGNGDPVDETVFVQLGVDSGEAFERSTTKIQFFADPRRSDFSADGVARFEHVEVGLSLLVGAGLENRGVFEQRRMEGPSTAGDERRLEVRLPDRGLVKLRLVDLEGAPVADSRLVVRGRTSSSPDAVPERRSVQTDDRGLLSLMAEGEGGPWLDFEIEGRVDGTFSTAFVDLATVSMQTGPVDLGDIVLEPHPVVVTGVVLGADGSPVAGAEVRPMKSYGQGDDPNAQNWRWNRRVLPVVTDAEGRFEFREPIGDETGRIGLLASKGARRGDQVSICASGDRGVIVRLGNSGGLEVRMTHADLDDIGRHVGLCLLRADAPIPDTRTTSFSYDGQHEFTGLEPGYYKLLLEASGGGPLHTIENLEVIGGAVCKDPRLDPLDLTQLLPVVRLTVLTPYGTALEEWQLGRLTGGDYYAIETVRGNEPLLCDASGTLTGFVTAPGYGIVELNGVSGDAVVTLTDGVPATIEISGLDPALEHSRVTLQLTPIDSDFAPGGDGAWYMGMEIDPVNGGDGSWSTVLPKLGSYQAQIAYVEDNGQGGQWTALKGFTELTFDEGSTAATIVVPKGMQAQ